jgi:cytochrome oxidase assembly protein ShyY1
VRSLRFLVSRRWVLFAIAVAVAAYGAWLLGEWQFHRLADRKASNAIVERNTTAPPATVGDVLAPGRPVAVTEEWRVVEATGSYAPEDTVIVRYRTRDGASGADVVVPLVTPGGTALLVDRGWMATDNTATEPVDAPAPPSGEVTVTGWVRVDATGDSTAVSSTGGALSTRAISSDRIGEAIDQEVYGGFVDLRSEDPAPETPLERAELPELDSGPHFFYGLQWWFFGVLAIVGFGYLAFDEWRKRGRTG